MDEQKVRQIIRDELQELLASDRYIFHKTVQFLDGRNVQFGLTSGTKFGTATAQKIGFFNTTPVIQPTNPGTTTGFSQVGGGTTVQEVSTFSGNTGASGYTIGDIVRALKLLGIIAS